MPILKKIDQIFSILAKNNPLPKTELNFSNEFTLLVAIVLSAQSTDIGVNKATLKLFEVVKTPQDLQQLGLAALKTYIKTLGLYNNKAKSLIALANMLLSKYHGAIPANLAELEQLPGVGSKTARVFLNCAHNIPTIAVDTHVFRVSNRIGLTKAKLAKQVEIELNKIIPEQWKLHAHHWLILHGRYICKARNPDCLNCPINAYCDFYKTRCSAIKK
jgi:endonuclease-3